MQTARTRSSSPRSVPALAAVLVAVLLGVAGCGGSTGTGDGQPSPGPLEQDRTTATTATSTPTQPPTAQPPTTQSPTGSPDEPRSPYVARVPEPEGCRPVSAAIVGVKVYLVQQALGLVGHQERYDADTRTAVRSFQADHGLPVDGVVGPRTWEALGIAEPYCVDTYTAQPNLAPDAGPKERAEAMIAYARARVGTPYIWGGAGPMGFDCSGLALQAMYAGGRTVPGVDTFLHVQADFRSAHAIYESSLPHVPFEQRRRGDLIFYNDPITHMAIYLGHDRILEAVRPVTREAGLYADELPVQPLVVRPFPAG